MPTKGSCRRNVRTTGKKSLDRKNVRRGNQNSRQFVPKEIQESKGFYDHPNERVFEKDEQDTTEEANRSTQLLLASKERECFLGPDDEREAREEQQLARRVRPGWHWHDGTPTFPSASRAASKKSTTPRHMNSVPNVVSVTPISAHEKWSVGQAGEQGQQSADFVHQRAT